MRHRHPFLALVLAGAALGACAGPPVDTPLPTRPSDFRPSEIRHPALFVHFSFGRGEFGDRERAALPSEYEAALLEGLNARAVLARDVRLLTGREAKPGRDAVLARAREVQADHAVIVDVTVARDVAEFCRGTRRVPLRAPAMLWMHSVEVVRVRDGARRLAAGTATPLVTTDVEADCENPRESVRRSLQETLAAAVDRLLTSVLGP